MSKVHPLKGRKQTKKQIAKRVESTRKTKDKWTDERRQEWKDKISENNAAGRPEVRKKNSESHIGQAAWNKGLTSVDDSRICSEESHGMYGKHHTSETIAKISITKTGIKQSPELVEKRIAPLRGVPRPESVKEKIRNANLKTWSDPDVIAKVSGENSASWLGGISKEEYGVDFNKKLKTIIRERDNFVCQECGEDEGNENLSVHHIDYQKQNNSFYNLICLCRSCHIKTNYNREHWQEKYTKQIQIKYKDKEIYYG